jgi:molybdopterin synthase catalytic subunit
MTSPMLMPRVRIQPEDFDLSTEVAALRSEVAGVGAVVSFLGTVREHSSGDAIQGMTLEHYPGMTEASIEAMIQAARTRFNILAARVIHRVGPLLPQDQIVWVGVAAAHRGEAFAACEYLMDYLKTQAPFWKKENTADGGRWVDARASDDAALRKWVPVSPTIAP